VDGLSDDKSAIEKPTFKGTRIPVSDVIELLATGLSIEEIVRDYYPSLSEEMVKEALHRVAKIIRGDSKIRPCAH
jgi:uncharacterized protein (DUF433 family)